MPTGLEDLRTDARGEGHRVIGRLIAEWASGATRFDRDGERLLAAYLQGVLAGIGGLTMEPAITGALRMRRFYVRPRFRRQGVGRELAATLLGQAMPQVRLVTVNAATPDAPAFWEALGFVPDRRDGFSHILRC